METEQAQALVDAATVTRQADRPDEVVVWTVSLIEPLNLSVDFEVADEETARTAAVDYLVANVA